MIFNRSELKIYEQYNIKLTDEVLGKLEDAAKNKKELLITIDASHLGMVNGHGVIYRHDTIRNNIQSFIYPKPKPMIERHRTATSDKFGHIVAADYKQTKFYDELDKEWQLEGLTTNEYLDLCRDVIIPKQRNTSGYNGVAFVQVMGKLKHQDAIDKVLRKEFLNVSIGADPRRLICSECGQDQVLKICDHYSQKGNGIFMLAEELEYEELSFVPKGADPYGRVIQIHDEQIKLLDIHVDVFDYNDFHKIVENKTIVCVNNICKIMDDQEEEMARRKTEQTNVVSMSYKDEFAAEKLKEVKINDELVTDEVIETLALQDEMTDDQFAIVQKTEDGLKRRFPISDETSVKLAIQLIDSAEDLTDGERTKASKAIVKAMKKFGIECACKDEQTTDETTTIDEVVDGTEVTADTTKTLESITDELIAILKEVDETKLQDEDDKPKPITFVMGAIASLASSLKWAGEDLKGSIDYYLKSLGQEAIDKGVHDELRGSLQTITDELAEVKEEVALLDEQNIELNYQIRVAKVDEVLSFKDMAEEDVEDERKRLSKLSYETLKELASELKKTSTKSTSVVINNKEVKIVKDPTLTDELGDDSSVAKLEDEEKKPLSSVQLAQALSAYFRNNR